MKKTTISAAMAGTQFDDILRRADCDLEHLIIEQEGTPVVVILPFADYEQFLAQTQRDAEETAQSDVSSAGAQNQSRSRLIDFLDEIHATLPDVPEDDAQKDIEEAIAAIRNQPKC